jgi:molybdate transport system substrate-binding protein
MRVSIRAIFVAVTIALIVAAGCSSDAQESKSLTVFCGSANKPAMEEIAALYEEEKGIDVKLVFGGSGTLLSQIELSRSGEIYLPGSPDYAIIAERKKQIIPGSDHVVAYLVPAIVTPKGNPKKIEKLEDLARPGVKVGIGNPETVCLGLYGVELLERNGLLDGVLSNVVTFGASCSKTANLAAMSQVDAILGWRVFHYWNPERMDYVAITKDQIPRISYIPIMIPVHTKSRKLSEDFIKFVLSERGMRTYEKLGYLTDVEKARQFAPTAEIGGEYRLPDDYFERIKNRWQGE